MNILEFFVLNPISSETELFLEGAFLQDISENQDKFLFTTDNNAFAGNNNIYYLNDNTLDSLVLTQGCYYARFTQSENEIIYHKPTLGQGSLDKIYSYSFDSDTTRLGRFCEPVCEYVWNNVTTKRQVCIL